ncbi:MAG: hypothetical protein RLZZ387_4778 [Chloroflexota bacterium]|jgi:hypothetical protein
MRRTDTLRLGVLLAAVLLAASCGNQPTSSSPAPTLAVTAPLAEPTRSAAAAPDATAAAPPATAPTVAPAVAAGIPRGRTPEGYNYLGSPDAPVTLQDFSDFF